MSRYGYRRDAATGPAWTWRSTSPGRLGHPAGTTMRHPRHHPTARARGPAAGPRVQRLLDRVGEPPRRDRTTGLGLGPRAAPRHQHRCRVHRPGRLQVRQRPTRARGRENLEILAARTRTVLSQPYVFAGVNLHLTASVGVAVSDGKSTVDSVLHRADAQMYEAKATRRALADITDRD